MNNIFLVTSGLNVDSGLISPQDRLQQTLDTARSIKQYAPGSTILLLEGGKYPLTFEQRVLLKDLYDDIIDFTYHPTIQFAHNQNVNVMYTKGPCESLMLYETCKILPKNNDYRIFKISGRYQLYDKFCIVGHNVKGKYVFKTKELGVKYYHDDKNDNGSQLQNIDMYFTPYQYKTRLYSFCGSLLETVTQNYNNIFQTIVSSYINHGYIDIEHATYKNIDLSLIHEMDVIGLKGIQAENAIALEE
jgi:hypothetical protein